MTDTVPEVSGPAGPKIGSDLIEAMRAACKVLESNGMPGLAQRAWSQLSSHPGDPTIVVIGEVKRGKSSLVNALLACPDACPVDVDITTSAFVRFVTPDESRREGSAALLFAGGRRQTIDLGDLPDWVTLNGCHVTDPRIDELPIGAEVVMASPYLPRVTLVDTPGVGGLNPNHLRLTKTALSTANILLMVCDATAPITAPELSFLANVSAEVDSVMIAVTKIDKNLRHWRAIVDANRALLRQYAPRFAQSPMEGVSSWAALSALELETGERREGALRASGLPTVAQQLAAMCAAGDMLCVSNGLRAARSGLTRVANQLDLQRSATLGGPGTAAELNAEKQRLQALRREWEGGWRDYLARDLAAVQRDTLGALDHKLDELKIRWHTKLDHTQIDILRHSPQQYVAEMTADLEALVGEVSDEYVEGVTSLISKLNIEADISLDALDTEVREVQRPRKRGEGVLDPSMLSTASSGIGTVGLGLAGLLATALGGFAVPLGLAVGGAYLAVNFGFRAIKMGRQSLDQWLNMTASAVAKDVAREIQERGDSVRPAIINEYKNHLTESMDEIKRLMAAAELEAKKSRAERISTLTELDERRKSVRGVISAIDSQLAELKVASDPAAG